MFYIQMFYSNKRKKNVKSKMAGMNKMLENILFLDIIVKLNADSNITFKINSIMNL